MEEKELYLKNIICDCDPDMSDEALDFYRDFFAEYFDKERLIPYFRGDCMNSLGWTFGKKNKEGTFNPHFRSYTRLFTKEDIDLFYKFREVYHSKANFIILPSRLNSWRGSYRKDDNDNYGYGTCDYFDVLLSLIRMYFYKENICDRALSYIEPYKGWLESYGAGESGWVRFLKKNYLMPFVNNLYMVKDMFANHDMYKNTNCKDLLGSHHGFDYCLPGCSKNGEDVTMKTAKDRVVNYMLNSLWIWDERASLFLQEKKKKGD